MPAPLLETQFVQSSVTWKLHPPYLQPESCFEIESYVTKTDREFTIYPRKILNFWSSCLHLPRAGVHDHNCFMQWIKPNRTQDSMHARQTLFNYATHPTPTSRDFIWLTKRITVITKISGTQVSLINVVLGTQGWRIPGKVWQRTQDVIPLPKLCNNRQDPCPLWVFVWDQMKHILQVLHCFLHIPCWA